jgi:hypothetical protein
MSRVLVNQFEPGEQDDLLLKENETFEMSFNLADVSDTEVDEDGCPVRTPVDLTDAEISGGVYESYDNPNIIKAFDVEVIEPTSGGTFNATIVLGREHPKIDRGAWDIVVKLADGKLIRAGAGFWARSRGVTFPT